MRNEEKPGCFGYMSGMKYYPVIISGGLFVINHEIRIPMINNQDSMESEAGFFLWLICSEVYQLIVSIGGKLRVYIPNIRIPCY